MANRILNKRGLITGIEAAVLKAGEFALAFNADYTKVQLWVGISTNSAGGTEKLLVNPDVLVPTTVSELTNDSGFQTAAEVAEAIAEAIAGKGTASFTKAESVPDAADASENVLYLVKNTSTGHYDIYAKIDGSMELIDDTTVDLSGYVTSAALTTILAGYVQKDGDKVLSDNNYTDAEKQKLAGIAAGANNYTHPSTHAASMIEQNSTHQFVSDTEKQTWNSKMDADADIDCGTF